MVGLFGLLWAVTIVSDFTPMAVQILLEILDRLLRRGTLGQNLSMARRAHMVHIFIAVFVSFLRGGLCCWELIWLAIGTLDTFQHSLFRGRQTSVLHPKIPGLLLQPHCAVTVSLVAEVFLIDANSALA